ncbi:hypothetical protein CCMA1212_005767 [Trichoderma ghanense]|uniref:Uncharacterized protein n=1 Tax=Trichoderma ghanense TaxID=65468 RepID=A0ABY2H2J2_9HYPO
MLRPFALGACAGSSFTRKTNKTVQPSTDSVRARQQVEPNSRWLPLPLDSLFHRKLSTAVRCLRITDTADCAFRLATSAGLVFTLAPLDAGRRHFEDGAIAAVLEVVLRTSPAATAHTALSAAQRSPSPSPSRLPIHPTQFDSIKNLPPVDDTRTGTQCDRGAVSALSIPPVSPIARCPPASRTVRPQPGFVSEHGKSLQAPVLIAPWPLALVATHNAQKGPKAAQPAGPPRRVRAAAARLLFSAPFVLHNVISDVFLPPSCTLHSSSVTASQRSRPRRPPRQQ